MRNRLRSGTRPAGQTTTRQDISSNLVHFTSGEDDEDAFKNLKKIIADGRLIGGRRYIKGNYRCVCFSEAPLIDLESGLVNEHAYSRYYPFGIMVTKKWLFALGGRPVIYQPLKEYWSLPGSHRWRHVTYELRESCGETDFTWEREWRVKCDAVVFDERTAQVVVPSRLWSDRLIRESKRDADYEVMRYALIFGQVLAEAYRRPPEMVKWTIFTLK